MIVILSIFDLKIGPVPFITIPSSFEDENNEIVLKVSESLNQALSDTDFISNSYEKEGINAISIHFYVPSPWGRGSKEMAQLSVLTTEEFPPIDLIKKKMIEYTKKISRESGIYASFYLNQEINPDIKERSNRSDKEIKEIAREKFKRLTELMHEFNLEITMDLMITKGYISKKKKIIGKKRVRIPDTFLKELENESTRKKNEHLFTVFRKDRNNGNLIITIIPSSSKIMRVRVKMKKYSPMIMKTMSDVIKFKVVFTTGICLGRGEENCYYESYYDIENKDFDVIQEEIKNELKKLTEIESVNMQLVTMNEN